jgi:hypothetical protein
VRRGGGKRERKEGESKKAVRALTHKALSKKKVTLEEVGVWVGRRNKPC